MAGPSDDRPPRPEGLTSAASATGPPAVRAAPAEPASLPGKAVPARAEAPDEEARWTSLAGWADITPTNLRPEDIDPDTTPRGGLRLAPLTPLAPFGPSAPPVGAAPPVPMAPPAAARRPFVPPAPTATPLSARLPPRRFVPSTPVATPLSGRSAMPAGQAGPPPAGAGPGPWRWPAPQPGAPVGTTHGAWAAAAGPLTPAVPFWRRRPALSAALLSLVMLLVAVGIAWVAVAPSCCTDGAAAPLAGATPAAAVPSPTAGGGWTPAQRALADRLDPAVMLGCRPNTSPAGTGVTASLFCATPEGRQVAVYAYQDADALRSDVTERANGVPSEGRCERGENEVFSWDTGPGTPAGGTVVCHHRDGRAFLFWSSDADVVSFLAYDTDPRALVNWWESFEPFPDRAGPTAAPRPA
ncbi:MULTISPECIES: hypothetical protein [unclassified Pseudofrankia]|uniref:hypothetical protein n=1 Tax=unclassified Pseudofrankia TaxID=2994372 RepID=UPI0008D9CDFD|nr:MULTISPECIES: hypothetical protein [unclassified Pseudofrankia]MDT3438427.1 hypothetical protein [Pseudofrankia sp. BMG5.37]OHV45404.1 hypothetical protein BCD48_01540 [Pseudofrankia sp. BMG5.36]